MGSLACLIDLRRVWPRVLLAGLVAVVLGLASGARAPAGAQEVGPEDLESLLATVEDEDRRQVLIGQLKALIEARRAMAPARQAEGLGARLIATVSERTREIGEQVFGVARALSDFPVLLEWLRRQATDGQARAFWLWLLFKLAAVFAVGVAAERMAVALLRRVRRRLEDPAGGGMPARAAFLIGRTVVDMVPVAVFVAAAYVMVPLVRPDPAMHVVAFTLVTAYVLMRVTLVAARAVLAPGVAALRLPPLGDETANYLFIWVRRFTGVAVIGYFAAEGALLLGLPAGAHAGLLRLVGLVFAVLAVVFVLQNRSAVAAWIRRLPMGRAGGAGVQGVRDRLADAWHMLAIAYIVGVYAVAALGIEGGFEFLVRAALVSVVIVVVARMTTAGLRRLVERGFAIGDDAKDRFPQLEARANRYLPVVHMVLRTVVFVVAGLALLYTWGLDALGWLDTPLGQRMTRSAISIAAVLAMALIAWEFCLLGGRTLSLQDRRRGQHRSARRPRPHPAAAPAQRHLHRAGGPGDHDRALRAGHRHRAPAGRRRGHRPGRRLRIAKTGAGRDHRRLHPVRGRHRGRPTWCGSPARPGWSRRSPSAPSACATSRAASIPFPSRRWTRSPT